MSVMSGHLAETQRTSPGFLFSFGSHKHKLVMPSILILQNHNDFFVNEHYLNDVRSQDTFTEKMVQRGNNVYILCSSILSC